MTISDYIDKFIDIAHLDGIDFDLRNNSEPYVDDPFLSTRDIMFRDEYGLLEAYIETSQYQERHLVVRDLDQMLKQTLPKGSTYEHNNFRGEFEIFGPNWRN